MVHDLYENGLHENRHYSFDKSNYGNLKIAHTFQTISDILPIFIEMFLAVFYQPFDVMPSANFYTPVWKPVVLCYAPRHQSVHP